MINNNTINNGNNVQFINCTPHDILLNNGVVFKASGNVARVSNTFTKFDSNLCCQVKYGALENVPEPKEGVKYIVSAMVLADSDRKDLVAPATGHPDCVRDKGMIVSVPGFVTNTKANDYTKIQAFYTKLEDFLKKHMLLPNNGSTKIRFYGDSKYYNSLSLSFIDYTIFVIDIDDDPINAEDFYSNDMAKEIFMAILDYIDYLNNYGGACGNTAPIIRYLKLWEEFIK